MNIYTLFIKAKYNIENLLFHLEKHKRISIDELRNYFKKTDPAIPDSTIRWRIHDLVSQSVLSRIGHGLYTLSSVKQYEPDLSAKVLRIARFIHKDFPTTAYCSWDSGMINEFAQHISANPFILVDVERDVAESVFYRLKDQFKGVFLRPEESLIQNILPDFQWPIVVRYLTTESPISLVKNISTVSIEKLLADIFCDMEFNYLAGSECRSIFTNAYYKYLVNESKLLRYAARKGRREDLQTYLLEGNFNSQTTKS